nr:delta-aminolevulinic acid dehydratase (ALAD) [Polytomella parva]
MLTIGNIDIKAKKRFILKSPKGLLSFKPSNLHTCEATRFKAPVGTPDVVPQDLPIRPRRNRRSDTIRSSVRENFLVPSNLVLPLFVHEDSNDNVPVASMPGVYRNAFGKKIIDVVAEARSYGVNQIDLFPKTADHLKSVLGEESYNDNGLVQRTVRLLKDKFPDLEIYTDVALDPYSSDGHDGIVSDEGVILNDESVEMLVRQSLSHARAGADVVSPSET